MKAVVDAGWIITGSWPIDTEMEARVAAQGKRARFLRPSRLPPARKSRRLVRTDEIGDWRDVLQELPRRIHEWMPRLAEEGVVGADAIFACLGPALEIFSRYSRVEKASGETVTLKEYLEQVWAAVAKEALTMIFTGADTTGFEEDARLTAMWLWTLNAGKLTPPMAKVPTRKKRTKNRRAERRKPRSPDSFWNTMPRVKSPRDSAPTWRIWVASWRSQAKSAVVACWRTRPPPVRQGRRQCHGT